jgi:hypothetical protein
VLPKLPFLPLRLRRRLLQLYLLLYRCLLLLFPPCTLSASCSCTALPACLILRLLPHSTLHIRRCSPAQPSIATCCPHPRLTTVLERILLHVRACIIPAQAQSPALYPDRLQHTRSLCTARPAIPAALSCASPDSAAPSPQSAVALARTR